MAYVICVSYPFGCCMTLNKILKIFDKEGRKRFVCGLTINVVLFISSHCIILRILKMQTDLNWYTATYLKKQLSKKKKV